MTPVVFLAPLVFSPQEIGILLFAVGARGSAVIDRFVAIQTVQVG